MKRRLRAAVIHLTGTAIVVASLAWLVFGLWFPSPLATLAGGMQLVLLVAAVDLTLGPMLTAVVASERKPASELIRDVVVIVALQLAALAYGLYAVAAARPVALAFEIDVFRLVAANDVDSQALHEAPEALRELSWTGPRTIAAIKPTSPEEQFDSIQLALAGVNLSSQPRYWRSYDAHAKLAWQRGQPVAPLIASSPETAAAVSALARKAGLDVATLRALPLLARRGEGTVLLAPPDARIVGMLPVALPP